MLFKGRHKGVDLTVREFFLVFMLLLSTAFSSARAEHVRSETEILSPGEPAATLKVDVANGEDDAKALLKSKASEFRRADLRIVASSYSQEKTEAIEKELFGLDQSVPLTGMTFAFHNYDDLDFSGIEDTIQGAASATVQTGFSAIGLYIISKLPVTPATVSLGLAAALNIYYNLKPTRWPNYLGWSSETFGKFADLIGKPKWKNTPVYESVEAVAAGAGTFVFAAGFGLTAMYTGPEAWDKFHAVLTAGLKEFSSSVAFKAAIGFSIAHPLDNLLRYWLRNLNAYRYAAWIRVENLIRSKSMTLALLTPLVYVGDDTAIPVGAGLAVGTVTIWGSERFRDGDRNGFKVSADKVKGWFKSTLSKWFDEKKCENDLATRD